MSGDLPANTAIDISTLIGFGYSRLDPKGLMCRCPWVRDGTDGHHWCCNGKSYGAAVSDVAQIGAHRVENSTDRKKHYGEGRQPWDDIVDAGWAAEFAASNVLKYLRRDKEHEHSLESAKWYYDRLLDMARGRLFPASYKSDNDKLEYIKNSKIVLATLHILLSKQEALLLLEKTL